MRSNFGRIDSRLLVFGLALGALIVVAVVYAAWGVGSRWWVLRELERQHPAVTVSDKVDAALTTAIAALPGDRAAGVLLTAPLSKLVPVAAYSSKTPLQLQGATLSLSNVKLKGGDQQLEIELNFSLSSEEHGVVVGGRLVAAAIPSLERSTNVGSFELVVAPIVKSWRFEEAAVRGFKLNLAPAVNALGSSLQASASKISEHIGTVKIPVVLTSGPQDLKLKSTDGAERTVRLPSLIVDRAPILIANNSLYLLLQFQGASSTSTTAVQGPTGPTKFEVLKTEFSRVVKRDFGHDLNSPTDLTVEVASKLLQELGSVVQDPRRADEAVQASITSNSHRLAASSSSASIGFFISERRLQSALTDRIAESVTAIQREKLGLVSNPTVKIENQAIRLSASLSDMQVGENIGISGRVSGIVVPVVTPSSVKIVTAFDILEIDSLQIRGWRVDPLRLVLLLQQANEVLLPSINALLLPTEVKVDAIHAGKAMLPPRVEVENSDTKTGIKYTQYTPSEFTLPRIGLGDPVVLVDATGIRALVSVSGVHKAEVAPSAKLLPSAQSRATAFSFGGFAVAAARLPNIDVDVFRTIRKAFDTLSSGVPAASDPKPSFEEFKKQFDQIWKARAGDGLPEDADAVAFLRKDLLAEFINTAWPVSGVQANVTFTETSKLKDTRHRVGYVDTNLDCKREQCNRNACNRTENCARTDSCNRGACGREPGECSYSCEKCWRIGPYKDCKPDPICESGKAICNAGVESRIVACNTREEATRAECNVRAESAVAACNTRQESAIAACNIREESVLAECNIRAESALGACNIRKEALKGLSNIGDIGNTAGSTSISGSGAVVLKAISVSSDMQKASVSAGARATGLASADVLFTPYGGIGHILGCVAPIPLRPVARVDVTSDRNIVASASFDEKETDGKKKLVWTLAVPELSIDGKLTPSPAEALLRSNPEMNVVCPFVGATARTAALLGKGLTVLSGEQVLRTLEEKPNGLLQFGAGLMQFKVEAQRVEVEVPSLSFVVGSKVEELKASSGQSSLIYTVVRPLEIAAKR